MPTLSQLVFAFICVVHVTCASEKCPDLWAHYGEKCIKAMKKERTMEEAKEFCDNYNGKLVQYQDGAMYNSMLESLDTDNKYWLKGFNIVRNLIDDALTSLQPWRGDSNHETGDATGSPTIPFICQIDELSGNAATPVVSNKIPDTKCVPDPDVQGTRYKDVKSPDIFLIPGGLEDGAVIIVNGTFQESNQRFSVNFLSEMEAGGDIGFHFNPRLDEQRVVRNSYHWEWKQEEDDADYFPFVAGKEFVLNITVTAEAYEIAVNCHPFIKFNHRINLWDMKYLSLTEGAEYHEVIINNADRKHLDRAVGELKEGSGVRVRGYLNDNTKRFIIDFKMDTPGTRNIALHFNPRPNGGYTALNSLFNGAWGAEQRAKEDFPFQYGLYFDIFFLIQNNHFVISVNGKPYTSYQARTPMAGIKSIRVKGSISLMEFKVFEQLLNDVIRPTPNLEVENMIRIDGFHKQVGNSFNIKLLKSNTKDSGTALDITTSKDKNELSVNGDRFELPDVLKQDVPFSLMIIRKEITFQVYVNGKLVSKTASVDSSWSVLGVLCTGDIFVHSIAVRSNKPDANVAKYPGIPVAGEWYSVSFVIGDHVNSFRIDTLAEGNRVFHYNPRFNVGITVRNSYINGRWGSEERVETAFPFELNEVFDVFYLMAEDGFKVVVNGKHHVSYKYRYDFHKIDHIGVYGLKNTYDPEFY